ncbi:hypothetical protein PRUPE_2G272900 [Prunus persica]|uniref:Uncharacterized protein n=1 Tax=Prunus persica TaxID=3760 RepID=A0A251QNG1_PRUPE|nr:hypothetical protein PRUPE_2G272900 [Prunus persica]
MAAPKPEEISHPPMDQLQDLEYCIDSNPSWGTAVMIPSFLVPFMGGTDCCVGCFVKAFGRMDASYFLQGYYLYVYFCDGL